MPTPFLVPRSNVTTSLTIADGSSVVFASDPTTGLSQVDGNIRINVQNTHVATITSSSMIVNGNVDIQETSFIKGNGYTLSGLVDTTPLPLISNVVVTNDSWTPTDVQVLLPNSENGHIIVEGANFRPATLVQVNGITSPYTSFRDANTLWVIPPPLPSGTYPIRVIRPDGRSVEDAAVSYSPYPVWSTSSQLANVYYGIQFSRLISATEATGSLIEYTVTSGTLPFGMDLSSNGLLTGNLTSPQFTNSTYSFGVTATDEQQQSVLRVFSVPYVGLYESIRSIPNMVGWWDGSTWDLFQWKDKSGQNNDVIVTGTVTTGSLGGFTTLIGTTSTTFLWPTTILPEQYTLFHVCRYAGTTKRRIINGSGVNFLSGFYNNNVGVALHNTWITPTVGILPNESWVMSSDQLSTYRGNERNFVTTFSGTPSSSRLAINTGTSETSDFEIAECIVFNRELAFNEVLYVEHYLAQKYSIVTIQSLRAKDLTDLPTGIYPTIHGNLYILNTGTEAWVLVGAGRENFNFTDTGNGSLNDIVSFRDGTTPYWAPSLFVRTIMDTIYWQENADGLMVQRFNVNDAWRYRLQTTNIQFNWSLFLNQNTHNAIVNRYNNTQWWNSTVTYQSQSISSWTDISFTGSNETRCFTLQWSGHNNIRGFSAGATVTDGYQYSTEGHALQRVNVYARLK